MVSLGIDVGTKSYGIYILEDGKYYEFESDYVRENPADFVEFISSLGFSAGAGLSGYGNPVKKIEELSEAEIRMMTLNFDKKSTMGLRRVIEEARLKKLPIYTVPAVIHLPTVPDYRKINRIDMGTYDKVCSVAFVLHEYGLNQSFVLAELGYGFNAFIAVENGKIVDGIGGTSGFPGFSSLSAIDGELAYLLGEVTKETLFSGGLKSYFSDKNLDFDEEIFSEWVMKGIWALKSVINFDKVYISGRFAEKAYRRVCEEFEALNLSKFGKKISAIGASIIASGINGKDGKEVVERLELMKARGTVVDYLTSDIKSKIRYLF